MIKMRIFLPAGSKEVDDSNDQLLFAEILSSLSNLDQVAVNQVPAIVMPIQEKLC